MAIKTTNKKVYTPAMLETLYKTMSELLLSNRHTQKSAAQACCHTLRKKFKNKTFVPGGVLFVWAAYQKEATGYSKINFCHKTRKYSRASKIDLDKKSIEQTYKEAKSEDVVKASVVEFTKDTKCKINLVQDGSVTISIFM